MRSDTFDPSTAPSPWPDASCAGCCSIVRPEDEAGTIARRGWRMSLLLLLAGLFLATGLLGGCVNSGIGERRTLVFNRLPEADAVGLHVDVFRGNVRVMVDPDAESVVVQARTRSRVDYRVSPGASGSPDSARSAADDIEVVGEIVRVGRSGQGGMNMPGAGGAEPRLGERSATANLVVTARTAYVRQDLQWVDLDIIAPPVDTLHVTTTDGHVIIEGVTGAVTASTNDGALVVQTADPITGPVLLTNTNGDIHFNVSPTWRGLVNATAIGGEVDLFAPDAQAFVMQHGDSRMTVALRHGEETVVTERGQVISEPIPVTLQATNGDIQIVVDATPLRNLTTLRWWP